MDTGSSKLATTRVISQHVRLLVVISVCQMCLVGAAAQTVKDSRLVQAQKAVENGSQLRAAWKADSTRKAIREFEGAARIFRELGDDLNHAQVLLQIGEAYQALSEPPSAFANFGQALAVAQRARIPRVEIDALNSLAALYSILGENDKALEHSQRAFSISESTKYAAGTVQALINLGDTYYGLGELPKAVASYESALTLLNKLPDPKSQIRAMVGLGYALVELSEMDKALSSYQKAVALSQSTGDRRLEAISLRALGNFRTLLGDKQEALTTLSHSLNAIEGIDDFPTKADVFGGLGYLYDGLGEKDLALDYYGRALAIFQRMNHRWGIAEVQMVIGGIHFSARDYSKALSCFTEALTIFQALTMPRYEAWMLRGIGLIYDAQGDKNKALQYFRNSLSVLKPGQDQRYTAQTYNCIGRTYESLKDWKTAIGYYLQALELSRIAVDGGGEATTLYNLAHVELARGNLETARTHAEAALKITESLRTKVKSHELQATYFGTTHQQFTLYTEILMRLHSARPGSGFDTMAFEASERGRARTLLEAIAESRLGIKKDADVALLRRERELQLQLNAATEQRIQVAHHTSEAAELERKLRELTTAYQQIQGQIRTASPRYAALVQPAPLTLEKIQRDVLTADTLLLTYALGEERSFLWLVTPDSMKSFELPARTVIEDAARRVYGLLTERNKALKGETAEQRLLRVRRGDQQYAEAAGKLSEMLFGRVEPELRQKRLVIVADGALQYVPFGALPAPRSEAAAKFVPLIVDHEIVSLPSVSVLALMREEVEGRKPGRKLIAVLADPVFTENDERVLAVRGLDKKAGMSLAANRTRSIDSQPPDAPARALRGFDLLDGGIARLPFSRREADAIMAFVPAGEGMLAVGFRASRATAVSEELAQYRYIHFATHGLLNSEHPELSGILLSAFDESGKRQNGFLQLHEVYNLRLSADLVVLSACQTALGRDIRGEGLVGLTRGFMYAGVPRVLASLWQVDDAATADLMREFYKAMLTEGMRPAEALRIAQVRMSQQTQWNSPYYWAAFTLQGDWK
jgi:CHAT domain-containing protein